MKKEFMKKIYKSITLVAAILSLSSCGNDWLDRKPADGIPSEDAITNYNDALTARTGMYDGIQGNSNATSYYGARMFYYGEVRGEDMQTEKSKWAERQEQRRYFRLEHFGII